MPTPRSVDMAAPVPPGSCQLEAREPPPSGETRPQRVWPSVVAGLSLFNELSTTQVNALLRGAQVCEVRRGLPIIEQNGQDRCLFVLLRGEALCLRTDPRGREVVLRTLRVGDPIGELGLIDGLPHSDTVRSHVDCLVLRIPTQVLAECLPAMPTLAMAIQRSLVARLRHAHEHIASLVMDNARSRIQRHLLEASVERDGQRVVEGRISRQLLAKSVGASREMVSRTMSELSAAGLIIARPDGSTELKFDAIR